MSSPEIFFNGTTNRIKSPEIATLSPTVAYNSTTSGTINHYLYTSPYIDVDLLDSHHAGTTSGEESWLMVPSLAPLYRISPYIMIHLRSPSDLQQWCHQLSLWLAINFHILIYFVHNSSPTSRMVWQLEKLLHLIANQSHHIAGFLKIYKIVYDHRGCG